jgi:hypothetical protein
VRTALNVEKGMSVLRSLTSYDASLDGGEPERFPVAEDADDSPPL